MKLYIPSIGDRLQLTTDWHFQLYNESRNTTLQALVNDTRGTAYGQRITGILCIIPAGQVLKIDRIYIRKGHEDFDSVTFFWEGHKTQSRTETLIGTRYTADPGAATLAQRLRGHVPTRIEQFDYTVNYPARSIRFWAKLDDVNNIEFDPLPPK